MAKRTKAELARRQAWWDRPAWPAVILGVDPGRRSGAGIVLPKRVAGDRCGEPHLISVHAVDVYSRDIETVLANACCWARDLGLPLILAVEDWGRGGPLGIDQWLGLGAARGHWERAAMLEALNEGSPIRRSRPWIRVMQTTWRSMMIDDHGEKDAEGRHVPWDTFGWKRASTRALAEMAPDVVQESADAAEGGIIALYGSRSDEVGKILPKKLLARFGRSAP